MASALSRRPAGNIMIVEIGHFAFALALGLSLVQIVVPLWGARMGDPVLMSTARTAALAVFALTALSYATLTAAHVMSDFSVLNVVENSHTAKPLIYKLSGVWGSHEGSMLLWVLILSASSAHSWPQIGLEGDAAPAAHQRARGAGGHHLRVHSCSCCSTSNPFQPDASPRRWRGNDLNPVLQDLGLAIHPPLLYLGYVGFSMTFAFAMAALDRGPGRRGVGAGRSGPGRCSPGCS